MLEYSDFFIDIIIFSVKKGESISGPVVYDYLKIYSKKFDIYLYIRFNSRVDIIIKKDYNS